MDTRPNWDDTGITVVALFGVSCLLGAFFPVRPWLQGLIIGGTLWGFNVAANGSYDALVSIPVALLGSYLGSLGRKRFGTSIP
jgi:hypothetical protein